jgi:hypothetical protein
MDSCQIEHPKVRAVTCEGYTGGFHLPRDKHGEMYATVTDAAHAEHSQQSFA